MRELPSNSSCSLADRGMTALRRRAWLHERLVRDSDVVFGRQGHRAIVRYAKPDSDDNIVHLSVR
jgi:hypothetical protein